MIRMLIFSAAVAIMLFPPELHAQARRIVLFEHFTNASCGPCASQNPVFQDNILASNKGNMLHIAYHTVWPGRDPMNAYNKDDVASRVNYYSVNGVPDIIMSGGMYHGGPSGVTQDMINHVSAEPSPLRIRVRENTEGTTRHVDVDVTTLGQIATSGLILRTAVIEKEITYATAPGSNGEKYFPNVFRRFINTSAGDAFMPAEIGHTTSLQFEYELDSEWNADNIFTVVWIQHDPSKEVINASAAFIPAIELITEGDIFLRGTQNTADGFSLQLQNLGDNDQNIRLYYSHDQSDDWDATFSVDGVQTDTETDVTVAAHSSIPLRIDVLPGAGSGVGEYKVSMQHLDDTEQTPQRRTFNLLSNVTELLINNDGSWGSGEPDKSASDWDQSYLAGLQASGSTTIASIPLSLFLRGTRLGKLSDVKYLYYNVGWAFPAITPELASAFILHLNTGGALLVAGQDVGWDIFADGGHGSSAARAFYRNYLFSNFSADGDQTNSTITPVSTDPVFNTLPAFQLANVYGNNPGGTPYFYPDVLKPTPSGSIIAYYGNQSDNAAIIRGKSSKFKTINLGFGIEQIQDATIRETLMHLVWQWFHDILTSSAFDNAVKSLTLAQNYPNPATDISTIPVASSQYDRILEIYDIIGRQVQRRTVAGGSNSVQVDVSGLRPGMYTYRLIENGIVNGMNVMLVAR